MSYRLWPSLARTTVPACFAIALTTVPSGPADAFTAGNHETVTRAALPWEPATLFEMADAQTGAVNTNDHGGYFLLGPLHCDNADYLAPRSRTSTRTRTGPTKPHPFLSASPTPRDWHVPTSPPSSTSVATAPWRTPTGPGTRALGYPRTSTRQWNGFKAELLKTYPDDRRGEQMICALVHDHPRSSCP